MPSSNALLESDLRQILSRTESLWELCRGKTVLLTGGTGFFGKWFLETISFLNSERDLNLKVIVVSRAPDRFLNEYPHFKQPAIQFIQGDIRSFPFPKEPIHYIIHAGSSAGEKLNCEEPLEMFETIVDGTRYVLSLAREKKVESFLFTSSGAVYGKQPAELTHIPESYAGAPDSTDARSAYGEGKRAAEMLCSIYYHQYHVPVKIARCFAFVGPYLPLDAHFAIGNFILNVLKGEDILIQGDGTPFRSYLYATDLMIWLWTILLRGKNNEPYNVGSDKDSTIYEIAQKINESLEIQNNIVVLRKEPLSFPALRYIPSVEKCKRDLQLKQIISLDDCIRKTYQYYLNKPV
ncbi:MAG: NAD-dependent epimerase/dehydratase family protein [Bacteroidota bacterium]